MNQCRTELLVRNHEEAFVRAFTESWTCEQLLIFSYSLQEIMPWPWSVELGFWPSIIIAKIGRNWIRWWCHRICWISSYLHWASLLTFHNKDKTKAVKCRASSPTCSRWICVYVCRIRCGHHPNHAGLWVVRVVVGVNKSTVAVAVAVTVTMAVTACACVHVLMQACTGT